MTHTGITCKSILHNLIEDLAFDNIELVLSYMVHRCALSLRVLQIQGTFRFLPFFFNKACASI